MRSEHRQRRLRIGASFTIAEYLLPGWLSALRREAPVADVKLAVQNSAHVERAILAGQADIGFVEGARVPAGVEAEAVGEDELVPMVDPDILGRAEPRRCPWRSSPRHAL